MARCRAPKPRVIENVGRGPVPRRAVRTVLLNVGRGPVPRRAVRTRSSLCSLRSPDRKQVLSAPFYIQRSVGACPPPTYSRVFHKSFNVAGTCPRTTMKKRLLGP